MLNNMTIKSRLTFVIGLLSMLLIGVGSLGIYGLNQTNDAFRSTYEDRAVPLGDLALIVDRMQRIRLNATVSAYARKPEEVKARQALNDQRDAEIAATWQKYLATSLTPIEKTLVEQFNISPRLSVDDLRGQRIVETQQILRDRLSVIEVQRLAQSGNDGHRTGEVTPNLAILLPLETSLSRDQRLDDAVVQQDDQLRALAAMRRRFCLDSLVGLQSTFKHWCHFRYSIRSTKIPVNSSIFFVIRSASSLGIFLKTLPVR